MAAVGSGTVRHLRLQNCPTIPVILICPLPVRVSRAWKFKQFPGIQEILEMMRCVIKHIHGEPIAVCNRLPSNDLYLCLVRLSQPLSQTLNRPLSQPLNQVQRHISAAFRMIKMIFWFQKVKRSLYLHSNNTTRWATVCNSLHFNAKRLWTNFQMNAPLLMAICLPIVQLRSSDAVFRCAVQGHVSVKWFISSCNYLQLLLQFFATMTVREIRQLS